MAKDNITEDYRRTRINIFLDIAKELKDLHKVAADTSLPCDLRQVISMGMETTHFTLKQFLGNDEKLFDAVLKVILGTAPAK